MPEFIVICAIVFTGSYSWVKAHLLKTKRQGLSVCSKVRSDILVAFQREVAEAEERSNPLKVSLPPSSQNQKNTRWGGYDSMMMTGLKRKKVENNPLEKEFNIEARSQLDSEICLGFLFWGFAFSLY